MDEMFEDIEIRFPSFWVEIFPVLQGLRSASIVEVPDEDVQHLREYLDCKGVFYQIVTVDELNEKRKNRGKDLFLNRCNDNLFYIADEMRKVRTLVEGDFNNDFFCVGMMLGYPDCCVAEFYKRGTESVDIASLSKKFPMITHIPCSQYCGRTALYDQRLRRDKENFLRERAKQKDGR